LKTPVSHMLLVLVASIFGSIGAAFLKYGAQELHRGWLHLFNWRLATGVALFLISSYFFVLGLRPPGELSVLYPMVAVSYIWTLLWSRIFFKEPFTRQKMIGLLLIVAGVCCVGAGSR
jgi:multidrug transporter EmrE-like cation transporter